VVGRPLNEQDLRKRCGINVLGIMRKEEMISKVCTEENIQQHDILQMMGNQLNIDKFRKWID